MFEGIAYLESGNEKQRRVYTSLTRHSVFDILHPYSPLLAGTIPLGIDIAESDLDIICYWTNREVFLEHLIENFSTFKNFHMHAHPVGGRETILCRFEIDEFKVEVFAQNRPSHEQEAFRHMVIEHRILEARGEEFRKHIVELKKQGLKTEPAFAQALGLSGDPYEALLKFEG